MTASLLPNGKQQFIDQNGQPLVGGLVYFYVPGTTTPKDTWQDSGQVTLNTNPVVLDDFGEAIIYGTGSYRQILTDYAGNQIWDAVTMAPLNIDFTTLPTTLPSEAGVLWNNGGVLCISS